MPKFTTLTSPFIPLPVDNIDTDQIIPARYLKVTDKQGLGEALFYNWRYLPDGSPNPDFALNQTRHQGAQILVAGDNFGCGSSREHAPWALTTYGFRAVVSTSFADIFRNNALKNGLLPIVVDPATQRQLFDLPSGSSLTVDLLAQTLAFPGGTASFPIDGFSKSCLLNGVDELGYLLGMEAEIAAYERQNGIAIIS